MSTSPAAASRAAPRKPTGTPREQATGRQTLTRPLVSRYEHRSGQHRRVIVAIDRDGLWVVYDAAERSRAASTVGHGWLVERLDRPESCGQAQALAKEYVADQRAYRRGARALQACPDPACSATPVRARVINTGAARARAAGMPTQAPSGSRAEGQP